MDCQKVNALLEDYLNNKLAKVERDAFEEHLVNCSLCQSLFLEEDENLDYSLAGNWFLENPPKEFLGKVLEGLPEKKPTRSHSSTAGLVFWGLSIYGLLFMLMLAFYLVIKVVDPFTIRSFFRTFRFALLNLTITSLGYFAILMTMVLVSFVFYYSNGRERVI